MLGLTGPWASQVAVSPNLELEVWGGVTRKGRSCDSGQASKERPGGGQGISLLSGNLKVWEREAFLDPLRRSL